MTQLEELKHEFDKMKNELLKIKEENISLKKENVILKEELKQYKETVDDVIEDAEEVGTSFEVVEFTTRNMGIHPEDDIFINKIPLNNAKGKEAVKVVLLCPDNQDLEAKPTVYGDVTAGIVKSIISQEDQDKGLKELVLFDGFEEVELNESIMLIGHRKDTAGVKKQEELRNGDTYGVMHFDEYKINALPESIYGDTLDLTIKTKSAQSETLSFKIYYKD